MNKITFNKSTLDNGLRILTSRLPYTNSVGIVFLVGCGSRHETNDIAGVSHLIEHVLFKGTKNKKTPKLISSVVEDVGGSINAFTDKEATGYWCKIPLENSTEGISLFADMFLNSLFRIGDINKEKKVIYEEIRSSYDSPASHVNLLFENILWPNHAMGRDIAGSINSVENISRSSLLSFFKKKYTSSNTVVSVVGNINHNKIVDLISKILDKYKKVNEDNIKIYAPKTNSSSKLEFINKKTEQVHINIGFAGMNYLDDKKYSLSLLSVILGETMGSRLFEEIRESRGLAYNIGSNVQYFKDTGSFFIDSAVEPKNVKETIKVVQNELEKVKQSITEEELLKAKKYTIGKMYMRLEDTMSITNFLGFQEITSGKIQTIEEITKKFNDVTTSCVEKVANDIFDTTKMVISGVGPIDKNLRNSINNYLY